jgi:hypothetical protein
MRDQQKEVAFNLGKAEEYRKKADAATDPRMKAAFKAVVREYLAKARAADPALPRQVGTE